MTLRRHPLVPGRLKNLQLSMLTSTPARSLMMQSA
jgi:hypothetical protein